MSRITKELLDKHIKTHCEREDEDRAAVSVLNSFLRSGGRINSKLECNDKWPNTDGVFEYVSNPAISRRPEQNFSVQIKGTCNYSDKDGIVKYSLNSLAFPAYILQEVTSDPGILFLVLNPNERNNERVFWKYMSMEFLTSIDYTKDSYTISFTEKEEIKNTNESIDYFCDELDKICKHHSFAQKLERQEYSLLDVFKIVRRCDEDITESIERFEIYNDTRDNVSKRILCRLEDLCQAALLINAIKKGSENTSLQLAWELALLNRKTKYLSNFFRMLKYIGRRVPDDGQSERLMLKYYDFMWQIRKDFEKEGLKILSNLEKFPLKENKVDKLYYETVASAIEGYHYKGVALRKSRYYIEKETPFYINGKRYYEITLQLAGVYATKFDRLTVYSKVLIPSSYSIQIGYDEVFVDLWDLSAQIKYVTGWKVSIEPSCLNMLAKTLRIKTSISTNYGEYDSLMSFLTQTGMNLLEFIDLKEIDFKKIINKIYSRTNTDQFRGVLLLLRRYFNAEAKQLGKNTIRYLLLRMREEIIESVLPENNNKCLHNSSVYLSSKCFPFENNPLLSNLAGSKTSRFTIAKDVLRAVGYSQIDKMRPYLFLKKMIGETGEIYFEKNILDSSKADEIVNRFNKNLDNWEQENGFALKCENGFIYIDSFEKDTITILTKIIELSHSGNIGQDKLNNRFIKTYGDQLEDNLKVQALRKVFVTSNIFLIYGAAGTGKTTLINYISNLMTGHSKLFITKTHTALQNLQARIDTCGVNSRFSTIDSFVKNNRYENYEVVFVDECSTIDNRTMSEFFAKINSDTFVVLAGDIYQLDSIDFGNWFTYAKELVKDDAKIELLNTWRTEENSLINLWQEVRERGILIREKLAMDGPYSEEINKSILIKNHNTDSEVVLCLNYDGKFGLNNINALFQANNQMSEAFIWQEWSYKVGDPVLFTDSKRFSSVFYNNLKGKIVNIEKNNSSISFTVDIEIILTKNDCKNEVEYIETFDNTTRVKFTIYDDKGGRTDEERAESRKNSVVPFHLAYAVSIHKAQGLEYDSVKIIIPDSNAENITHSIFYTAITRAKKSLKIFWSPETMEEVLNSLVVEETEKKSLEIIKEKLSL